MVLSRILALLAFCCLAFSSACNAEDLVIKREVFSDASNSLDIDAIQQQSFKPIGQLLTAGYTTASQWLRLTVAPSSEKSLELRIRPTYLDKVTLYKPDPDHPGQWLARSTGDAFSFHERDSLYPGTFGFLIQGQPEPTVYYLKLQTTSTAMMYAEVLPPKASSLKNLRHGIILVVYLALMLWLTFWAANDFISHPHRLTGLFVLYQFIHIGYAIAIQGYLAPFLSASSADILTSLLILTVVFTGILFHYSLFSAYAPSRIGMRALLLMAAFYPFLLIALFTGHAREALQFNSYILLTGPLLFLILAFTASRNGVPSRKVLRIVYGLHSASLFVLILPIIGWTNTAEWNLNTMLAHSVISAFLMYIMLQQRSVAIHRKAEQTRLALYLAKQELVFEREKRDELGYFMTMITHELKTPLSVIRLSLDAMRLTGPLKNHVERSIVDISSMVDRCAQLNNIEEQNIQLNQEACDPVAILQNLVAEYGCATRVDISTDLTTSIHSDQLMLRLILRNLLENALKYSPAASPIFIRIEMQTHLDNSSGVAILFENNVETLPDIHRLFDKYYRSHDSHRQTGFGLGLYLSRAVAVLLNGTLEASLHDHHIRFHLCLPH